MQPEAELFRALVIQMKSGLELASFAFHIKEQSDMIQATGEKSLILEVSYYINGKCTYKAEAFNRKKKAMNKMVYS